MTGIRCRTPRPAGPVETGAPLTSARFSRERISNFPLQNLALDTPGQLLEDTDVVWQVCRVEPVCEKPPESCGKGAAVDRLADAAPQRHSRDGPLRARPLHQADLLD